ncbi:MAG TPA: serine/threonine-protein phosphatase [Anaerolineae bacterium]|nr:serine/threonine-protein phosphatase [Anaerolineae bacterium]
MTSFRIDVWGQTDIGKSRSENQDSIFFASKKFADLGSRQIMENGYLLAVADGVGGQIGGREASQYVVTSLADAYYALLSDDISSHLQYSIQRANEQAQQQVSHKHSASTLVACVIDGDELHVANVGDSRAYLIRDGVIQQLTKDHALNGRLMRYMVALAEADPEMMPVIKLQSDDKILLCSDGLYRAIPDIRQIATLAADYSPEDAARQLVDMANENGGPDNISVVIAHVLNQKPAVSWERFSMWASNLVS